MTELANNESNLVLIGKYHSYAAYFTNDANKLPESPKCTSQLFGEERRLA